MLKKFSFDDIDFSQNTKNRHIVCAGSSESGKSYFIKTLIKHKMHHFKQILIICGIEDIKEYKNELKEIGVNPNDSKFTYIPRLSFRTDEEKLKTTDEFLTDVIKKYIANGTTHIKKLTVLDDILESSDNIAKGAMKYLLMRSRHNNNITIMTFHMFNKDFGSFIKSNLNYMFAFTVGLEEDNLKPIRATIKAYITNILNRKNIKEIDFYEAKNRTELKENRREFINKFYSKFINPQRHFVLFKKIPVPEICIGNPVKN